MKEYRRTSAVDSWRFILRRGFKIWPPYFAYILFHIIVRRFPLHTFLWANLLQIQNYVGTSLSHTWTLSLEEHFYLFLAIAMGYAASKNWSPKRILLVFAVVIGAVTVSRVITIYLGDLHAATFYTHNRLDSLLFGVILAGISISFPETFDSFTRSWVPLAVISLLLLLYLSTLHVHPIWLYLNSTLAYLGYSAFLLLVLRHSGSMSKLWLYRLIARIGVYSYGIYLWHVSVRHPCYAMIRHLPQAIQWPALMISQLVTAIVLGVLMTHLIEWPFLRIRDRIYPDRRAKAVSPAMVSTHHAVEEPLVVVES